MSLPGEYPELADRVRERIDSDGEGDLSSLLLDVFRFQYRHVPVYRGYCERQGLSPGRIRNWIEIPAVPTTAFKVARLHAGPDEAVLRTFRTSGTTQGPERRGQHHLIDLALYDAALLHGFERHLLPDLTAGERISFVSLVPDPDRSPDSSLGHMAGAVAETWGSGEDRFARGDGTLDTAAAIARLGEAADAAEPIVLLTTAFALVHLLDAMAEVDLELVLPAGSRMMETGGFKGRARAVQRDALYRRAEARLGIEARWIVNEYGMTELGSQFYDAVAGEAPPIEARLHAGPGWTRTRAADPATLELLPHGEPGILRHWDPVNLGSVAVVQTEDMGVVHEDGSFRLLGRLPGAEPRGCSMALEEVRRVVEG